jgi:peptide-methionine (S)-S-oxide reductase
MTASNSDAVKPTGLRDIHRSMLRVVRNTLALGAVVVLGMAASGSQTPAPTPGATPGLQTATFAGGCFWCMEPPFDALDGVVSVTAGYTGGHKANPTYEEVSAGGTGHAEAVQIIFDPAKISYERLLDVFWHNIDPTTANGQFCDYGNQYRSGIFFHDDAQRRAAEASKRALEQSKPFPEPIVTEILPATHFWPAEAYHQKYYRTNPIRYAYYRYRCGRDQRLEALWGKRPTH